MVEADITYRDRCYTVGYHIDTYPIIDEIKNERGTDIYPLLKRLKEKGTPRIQECANLTLLLFENKILDHIEEQMENREPLSEILDLENF